MKKTFTGRHIMGKAKYCALLLCTALWCASCGTDTAATPESGAAEEPVPDNAPATDDTSDANTVPSDENAGQMDAATGGEEGTDISVSSTPSHIFIEMQDEEDNKTSEDGTVYLYKSNSYPVVTIDGNNDAAGKINADIRSRVDAFHANTQTEEWAKEDLAYFESEDNDADYPFFAYEESMAFQTARADNNVISFTVTYYAFTGGAHGNSETYGVSYNARTGEAIAFSDLSDDPAAFHEDTLAYNQRLAQTESYKERMFSEESVTDGTLESVLYADGMWYLSTSGLVFMSPPYALGPYAAGTIEFLIPYGDLTDMGFKNTYTYSDKFVLKLQDNETYYHDLNGDGAKDAILLYSEYAEDQDGAYHIVPHAIINDTDYASDGDDTVREQFAQSYASWAAPALYDLNTGDPYVELMLLSGETEGDDYVYYSHFFRYDEDGSLAYLGKARGDATDPTTDMSQLTVSME